MFLSTLSASRREAFLLAVLLWLALVLRVGVAGWRSDQLTIDRDIYLGLAENLAGGHGFCTPGTESPTAFRPPLYPLLLALTFPVLGAAGSVAVWNVLAGVGTVWLVHRLGVSLGLGAWRYLAMLFTACNPLLLHATPQPMTEAVFTFLVTAWLAAVMGRSDRDSALRSLMIGVLCGLTVLCRPSVWPWAGLMLVPWCCRVMFRWSPSPVDAATHGEVSSPLRAGILVVAGTALVVVPWMVRNERTLGSPILTTTHGGYTLLLANNPVFQAEVVRQPWGAVWPGDSLTIWQASVEARLQSELGPQADEVARDRWMSAEAKRYIRQHPREFLAAMGYRSRALWSLSARGEGTAFPQGVQAVVSLFFAVEFLLATWGLLQLLRQRDGMVWLPALLLIMTLQGVHLFYWTDTRMRAPLEPVLALLAARGVVSSARTKLPLASTSP